MILDFSTFSDEELRIKKESLMQKIFLMVQEPELVEELSRIEQEIERRKAL